MKYVAPFAEVVSLETVSVILASSCTDYCDGYCDGDCSDEGGGL